MEKADLSFIKELLDLDGSTPHCLILLELGLESLDIKIKKKRAWFLKYILDHPEDSCYYILQEQSKMMLKGDWLGDVWRDLADLEIHLSLKEIQNMSSKEWKSLISKQGKDLALTRLNLEKSKLKTKGKGTLLKSLKIGEYLLPASGMNQEEMKMILNVRTSMVDLPGYQPYWYGGSKRCRYGCYQDEDVYHTMLCKQDGIKKQAN